MNPVVLIVLALVFASFVLGTLAVWYYVKGKKEAEERRVQARLGMAQQDEEEVLASLLREQATDSITERLGNFGTNLELAIQQAGMETTVTAVVTQMVVLGFASFLGLGIMVSARATPLAFVIAYLPYRRILKRGEKRAKDLLAFLPDALEMMGRAMQTGAGLIDCFRLVQDEMPEPIASEFGQVSDSVRFGKDWRHALEDLIKRNPTLFDLRLLVSSILLQKETGGNMIETMNRISKLIRSRSAFDAKVKAMTSEARASGFILAMMPLGVLALVFVANPAYLEPLWTTMYGQMVCVYAVASYGGGIFLMGNMSKVEV